MTHFNITMKVLRPEGSAANEADIRHFVEGAITEYGGHLKDAKHPLYNLDDDDIQVVHVEKVEV